LVCHQSAVADGDYTNLAAIIEECDLATAIFEASLHEAFPITSSHKPTPHDIDYNLLRGLTQ
jgi:hypothetical protein